MKFIAATVVAALLSSAAISHDFWLQPKGFRYDPGATVPVTVQVGHGGARERWSADSKRVLVLMAYGPNGRVDLRRTLNKPGSAADLAPNFKNAGLYILAMQTNGATSELPAIRFNDYLKLEGLTPAIARRDATGTSGTTGRETYSRRAKALIRVGMGPVGGDPRATMPVGFALEIVPDRDPYALGGSRELPVHVLYQGKRLAGATVKLTSLEFDRKPVAIVKTDRNGRATFRVPPVGEWLLNVIWTAPVTGNPKVDFDTIFSSLTFGYDPPPTR